MLILTTKVILVAFYDFHVCNAAQKKSFEENLEKLNGRKDGKRSAKGSRCC